ncbi:MAG: carbohydrate ABC transporter permease [Lachnospirales bacterium]
MVERKTIGERAFNLFNVLFLILLSMIMLYPMLYEIFVSLSEPLALFSHRGLMFAPQGFSSYAYEWVLQNNEVWTGYKNTIFVIIVGLAVNLSLTSLGAYFLTRRNVMWHKPIMIMILITMYFSGGMVPFFLTVKDLGLYDSLFALIFPTAISTYNMILLRSYFTSIPESLVESVFIDGGGHFTILFRIFIPLSLPAMAVMVLYYGVGHWNTYFNALIFIKSKEKFTLQLVLRKMLIEGSNLDVDQQTAEYEQVVESIKAAMVVVSTLPILCIYPFLQKYFVGGIMIGSLKE